MRWTTERLNYSYVISMIDEIFHDKWMVLEFGSWAIEKSEEQRNSRNSLREIFRQYNVNIRTWSVTINYRRMMVGGTKQIARRTCVALWEDLQHHPATHFGWPCARVCPKRTEAKWIVKLGLPSGRHNHPSLCRSGPCFAGVDPTDMMPERSNKIDCLVWLTASKWEFILTL